MKRNKLRISKKKVKDNNLIKIKSDWQKKALVNRKQYEKKYNDSVKHNEDFWKKKEKELIGSNHIQK